MDRGKIERNIAMELVRVTEAAAMAAARYLGRGDKTLVDEAAVAAMRYTLGYIQMDGIVVIGEGEKDHAPMLYIGERIGDGSDLKVDIAVDPIDGTTLVASGLPGAISVVALAAKGTMHCPRQCVYMDKIVTGPEAKNGNTLYLTVYKSIPVVETKQNLLTKYELQSETSFIIGLTMINNESKHYGKKNAISFTH